MRYKSQHKEQFSFAYVHAIAASAGHVLTPLNVDVESADAQFRSLDNYPVRSHPRVDVQLKCTSQKVDLVPKARRLSDGPEFYFTLSLKNYNDLRANRHTSLRLIVVRVPDDPRKWFERPSHRHALARSCAYWLDLRNMKPSPNKKTVRVQIPFRQIFSQATLDSWFREEGNRL